MTKKHALLIAMILGLSLSSASTSHAGQSGDPACYDALRKARGWFANCFLNFLPRYSGNGSMYRHSYARCVNGYDKRWQKLQGIPDTNCVGPRWQDNLDGTVTDQLTGLVWEIKTGVDGAMNYADPHDGDNVYTVSDDSDSDITDDDGTGYTEFLAALNAGSGFAGANGWRLPTRMELASIVVPAGDLHNPSSTIDPVFGALPPTSLSFYVTSSSSPGRPDIEVFTEFGGDTMGESHGTRDIPGHARAVRGGNW